MLRGRTIGLRTGCLCGWGRWLAPRHTPALFRRGRRIDRFQRRLAMVRRKAVLLLGRRRNLRLMRRLAVSRTPAFAVGGVRIIHRRERLDLFGKGTIDPARRCLPAFRGRLFLWRRRWIRANQRLVPAERLLLLVLGRRPFAAQRRDRIDLGYARRRARSPGCAGSLERPKVHGDSMPRAFPQYVKSEKGSMVRSGCRRVATVPSRAGTRDS